MWSITNSTIQFRSNFWPFPIIKNSNVLSQTNEYAQRIGFFNCETSTVTLDFVCIHIYIYILLYMMYQHHVMNV